MRRKNGSRENVTASRPYVFLKPWPRGSGPVCGRSERQYMTGGEGDLRSSGKCYALFTAAVGFFDWLRWEHQSKSRERLFVRLLVCTRDGRIHHHHMISCVMSCFSVFRCSCGRKGAEVGIVSYIICRARIQKIADYFTHVPNLVHNRPQSYG